ncbi:MAG: tRNA pseudouridine(13) synthase TruD [Leptospiraceae bacterium]|nr:tRNA pseudouridine(13) synthase TruD [Leptospiraceae bacterium]MDW7975053.1 tRNA pseudouridine(13) synthase TruD [Leptospiraceae bacterium]
MKYVGFLSGKIKVLPEDFLVKEHLRFQPTKNSQNPYFLYVLKKSQWNTLDAIIKIAKQNQLKLKEIQYAGIKDRYGITYQHITSKTPLQWNKESQKKIELELIGKVPNPINAKDILYNEFLITIRNIQEKELPIIEKNAQAIQEQGVINYYDNQRFHSFHKDFGLPLLYALTGDDEKFFYYYLTNTLYHESKEAKDRKYQIRKHWGDWGKCKAISKTTTEKNVFEFLSKHPSKFERCFSFLPKKELELQYSIFQAYVWNQTISLLLKEKLPKNEQVYMKTKMGDLLFVPKLPSLEFTHFPLIHPHYLEDKTYKNHFDLVLNEMEHRYFNSHFVKWDWKRKLNDQYFALKKRKIYIKPQNWEILSIQNDEIYKNKKKLVLKFFLDSGVYATMVLKRLLLRTKQ